MIGAEGITCLDELVCEVFNTINASPSFEPMHNLAEFQCECEAMPEVVAEWEGIKTALKKLPPNVLAAICTLANLQHERDKDSFLAGVIRAARIVGDNGQPQVAVDLLESHGLAAKERLYICAAESYDAEQCLNFFPGSSRRQN